MSTKRLPPFGRHLHDVLAAPETWPRYAGTSPDGQHLTIWISIGPDSWAWARERQGRFLVLVVPPGDDPSVYDWSLLAGGAHDPILIVRAGDVSPQVIRALAEALILDGVGRVLETVTGDRYMAEVQHAA